MPTSLRKSCSESAENSRSTRLLDLLGLRGVEVGLGVLRGVERRDLFVSDGFDDDLDFGVLLEAGSLNLDLDLAHSSPSVTKHSPERMRNCRKRTGRTP